jgi:hypothetical protein
MRLCHSLLLALAGLAMAASAYAQEVTNGGDMIFKLGSSSATTVERMRITNAGLVGIGIANPTSTLEVGGIVSATRFVGDGSGLTGVAGGGSSDNITSGTSSISLTTAGVATFGTAAAATLNFTPGATNQANIQLGHNRTGSGYAYIDFIGDTTYSDYGLRIIRDNTGANASSWIQQRGTGSLNLYTTEAAPIVFTTTGVEAMRIAPSGYLGIGNSNPLVPLSVSQSNASFEFSGSAGAAYTGPILEAIDRTGTGRSDLNLYTTKAIKFFTGSTETMRITSGGDVGIGTNSPTNALTISTSTVGDGIKIYAPVLNAVGLAISNTNGQATLGVAGGTNQYANGSVAGDTVLRSLQNTADTNNLILAALTTSGSIGFRTGAISTDTEKMRITNAGLVGIGTSAPNMKLSVSGTDILLNTYKSAALNTSLHFRTDGATSYITNKDNFVGDGSIGNGTLYIMGQGGVALTYGSSGCCGTTGFILDSLGNVGIGMAPTTKLDVSGSALVRGYLGVQSGGSEGGQIVLGYVGVNAVTPQASTWNMDVDANNAYRIYRVNASSVALVALSIAEATGNATFAGSVTAPSYFQSSDARLKDNIQTSSGLAVVDKLRGVTFAWKKDGKPSAGVIAQEVEKVLPAAVATDEKGIKSVNYDQLIAPLIESVKELHRDNQKLAQEVQTLRAEVETLKKQSQ